MSGATFAGNYRALLGDKPLRRAFLVGLAGRFAYALLPLCLLFSIADASRSFALGATATAAFGVSGLAMPLQARLIDRHGQRRVLPLVAAWFTTFLTLVSVFASQGLQSPTGWVALCLLGGLAAPSLGPSMRAQWREATSVSARPSAYSLDSVAEEGLFLLGPLAASGILVVGPAWWGVAASALLIPIGAVGLVSSPYCPAARSARGATSQTPWVGPFFHSGFRRLALVMAAAGLSASAAFTILAGQADRFGQPAVAGLVETAMGIASVVGALWWGRKPPTWAWPRQMAALLLARTLPMAVCIIHPTLLTIAAMLALTGIAAAPTYVVAYAASDHETDPHQHTEASTWITSMNNIGISFGTATAGLLLSHTPLSTIFGGITVLLIAATVAVARTRHRDEGEDEP